MNAKEKLIGGAFIIALLVVLVYEARGISALRSTTGELMPSEPYITGCGRQSLIEGPTLSCKNDLCPAGQTCTVDSYAHTCGCKRVSSSSLPSCAPTGSYDGNGNAICPSNASCPSVIDPRTGTTVPTACTLVPGKRNPDGSRKTQDSCACKPTSSSSVSTSRPACGAASAPQCNGKCDSGTCKYDKDYQVCSCLPDSSSSIPTSQPSTSSSSGSHGPPDSSSVPSSYPSDPRACGNQNPSQCGDGACENNKTCKVYWTDFGGQRTPACGCFGPDENTSSSVK